MKSRISKIADNEYFFSVATKIYEIMIGVLISSLKVRFLGKDLTGRLLFMASMSKMLGFLFQMGYSQAYAYFKKREDDSFKGRYLGSAVLLTAVYVVICISYVIIFRPEAEMWFVMIAVPIVFLQQVMSGVVRVEKPKTRNIVFAITDTMLVTILLFAFFFSEPAFKWVVIIFIFLDGIRLIIFFFVERPPITFNKDTFRLFRKLFIFGIFPMLGAFLMNLNYKVDVYMLKKVMIYEIVAVYTVGVTVADQCWAITTALGDILISKLAKGGKASEVSRVLRYSNTLTLALQLVFLIFGKLAIRIVYGPGYEDSYIVLCLVMIGSYGMNFAKMIGNYCIVEGLHKERMIILLITVITNVSANLYLILSMGIFGAAISSIISYNVCGIMFVWLFRRKGGQRVRDILFAKKKDYEDLFRLLRGKA